MVVCFGKIHDGWCLVVLFVLDSLLFTDSVWHQIVRSNRYCIDLYFVSGRDRVVHSRWKIAYAVHQQKWSKPLCSAHESHVDFCILSIGCLVGSTPWLSLRAYLGTKCGLDFCVVDFNRLCCTPGMECQFVFNHW